MSICLFLPLGIFHVAVLVNMLYPFHTNHQESECSVPILSLSEPACFVKKLTDLHLPMNRLLKLQCSFIGAPKIFVTWYKDGKQVYASYRYNTKVTPNLCILECLHSSSEETSGQYSCEIKNAYGTDICHAQVKAVAGL